MPAASLANRITLIGFLGGDQIADFSLATQTSWKNDAIEGELRRHEYHCEVVVGDPRICQIEYPDNTGCRTLHAGHKTLRILKSKRPFARAWEIEFGADRVFRSEPAERQQVNQRTLTGLAG